MFVDIEPATLNLDPAGVRRIIEVRREQIGAILPEHYAGHPCELDQILELGRQQDLSVVEDAQGPGKVGQWQVGATKT